MKKLIGPVGSTHSLTLTLWRAWKPPGGRRTWCRAETAEGAPVGFWTASQRAQAGAVVSGRWEVERIKDNYTQLQARGRPKWQPSAKS